MIIKSGTSNPSPANAGDMYVRTDTQQLLYYDGETSTWSEMGVAGNAWRHAHCSRTNIVAGGTYLMGIVDAQGYILHTNGIWEPTGLTIEQATLNMDSDNDLTGSSNWTVEARGVTEGGVFTVRGSHTLDPAAPTVTYVGGGTTAMQSWTLSDLAGTTVASDEMCMMYLVTGSPFATGSECDLEWWWSPQ